MENNPAPTKSAFPFGLIFGVLLIFSFVIMYILAIDVSENPSAGTVSWVVNNLLLPVTFIIVGCNAFKKSNNGFISFGQALKKGVGIVVVGALIFAIFTVVFNFIFPEYQEEILRQSREIMIKQNPNVTEAQLEMGLSWTKKLSQPVFAIPLILVWYSFIGLIYSLIIGAIVKKEKPQSFN